MRCARCRWGNVRQRFVVEPDLAAHGRVQAGERVQQRGLAAAVGAEDHPVLAGREAHAQVAAQRAVGDGEREARSFEHDQLRVRASR